MGLVFDPSDNNSSLKLYTLAEDGRIYRITPEYLAREAILNFPKWFVELVVDGLSSDEGSLEIAARSITAS